MRWAGLEFRGKVRAGDNGRGGLVSLRKVIKSPAHGLDHLEEKNGVKREKRA